MDKTICKKCRFKLSCELLEWEPELEPEPRLDGPEGCRLYWAHIDREDYDDMDYIN